jgi:hypothetical protein
MAMSNASDRPWGELWQPSAPPGRSRRETDRLLAYWEGRLAELGGELTIAGLDLDATNNRNWSNRFLISVDSFVERSSLLLYGPQFARLLGLPLKPRTELPMMRQIPQRYAELFLHGCADALREMAPVEFAGAAERADGRIEQYRAIFVPIGVRPNALTWFAFGAFNNRILDPG